jgi:hypothetical protein
MVERQNDYQSNLSVLMKAENRTPEQLVRIGIAVTLRLIGDKNGVAYQNIRAINYARTYAGKDDNACGVYLNDATKKQSDCAHFISHCLNAGGITITDPDPANQLCPSGLAVRVSDLVAALGALAAKFDNVSSIDFTDAIIGDVGFFNSIVVPSHAFMICQPAASKDDYLIYAHTTNRPCTKPQPKWYQFFGAAFRLTDA